MRSFLFYVVGVVVVDINCKNRKRHSPAGKGDHWVTLEGGCEGAMC